MQKWVFRSLLLALVVYGGFRAVGWIEGAGEARYQAQDEMVRHVAEKKSEQVQRAVTGGSGIRTDALRSQLQQATGARDSTAVTR